MKVIIMRHGQADWSAPSDSERRLTEQGVQEVSSTAAQLAGQHIDRIIASPYLRAQQTAGIVSEACGVAVDTLDALEPDGDSASVVQALPESGVVLLVSHMPLVSCLAGLLCDGSTGNGPSFQTATALVLTLDMPGAGMAEVTEIIMPQSY